MCLETHHYKRAGGSRPVRKVGLEVYRILFGLDFHFELQKEPFIPMIRNHDYSLKVSQSRTRFTHLSENQSYFQPPPPMG